MQRNTKLVITIAALAALLGSGAKYVSNSLAEQSVRNTRIEEALRAEFNRMYGSKGLIYNYCPQNSMSDSINTRCNEVRQAFISREAPNPVRYTDRIEIAHAAEIGRQLRSELETKIH